MNAENVCILALTGVGVDLLIFLLLLLLLRLLLLVFRNEEENRTKFKDFLSVAELNRRMEQDRIREEQERRKMTMEEVPSQCIVDCTQRLAEIRCYPCIIIIPCVGVILLLLL